jgi:hypothetical protein
MGEVDRSTIADDPTRSLDRAMRTQTHHRSSILLDVCRALRVNEPTSRVERLNPSR